MGADDLHRLRQQVGGLTDTCKAVLAGRAREEAKQVDEATHNLALAILNQARLYVPEDMVLQAISLVPPLSWASLLAAMETINRTLPISQSRIGIQVGPRYTW